MLATLPRSLAAPAAVCLCLLWAPLGACEEEAPPLPELTQLSQFALTSQTGEVVSYEDHLKGSVWVANFVFTRCKDVCPLLTKKMRDLRLGLVRGGVPVRFVSFSVDPGHDTPEALKTFADKHQSLFDDWYFLTGSITEVREVVQRGFRQRMDRDPNEPANVFHGSHFVLVDQKGMIRGFYRSKPEGLLELSKDATRLATRTTTP